MNEEETRIKEVVNFSPKFKDEEEKPQTTTITLTLKDNGQGKAIIEKSLEINGNLELLKEACSSSSGKKLSNSRADIFEKYIVSALESVHKLDGRTKELERNQDTEYQNDIKGAQKRLMFETDKPSLLGDSNSNSEISSVSQIKNYNTNQSSQISQMDNTASVTKTTLNPTPEKSSEIIFCPTTKSKEDIFEFPLQKQRVPLQRLDQDSEESSQERVVSIYLDTMEDRHHQSRNSATMGDSHSFGVPDVVIGSDEKENHNFLNIETAQTEDCPPAPLTSETTTATFPLSFKKIASPTFHHQKTMQVQRKRKGEVIELIDQMETSNAEIPGQAKGIRHSKNKMAHFFSTYDLGSPESGSKQAVKKKKKIAHRKKNNFSVLR